MNEENRDGAVERVAGAMRKCGWLLSYERTPADGGHAFEWCRDGAQNVLLLRELCSHFGLGGPAADVLHFHMACCRMPLPQGVEIEVDRKSADFWLHCVDTLGLDGDPPGLEGMVRIVTTWGPEGEAQS